MPADAPLVVLLHGCSQQASGMDADRLPELADEYGFYLVLPQQRIGQQPGQLLQLGRRVRRPGQPASAGKGENQSIKQMVDKMNADHVDRSGKVLRRRVLVGRRVRGGDDGDLAGACSPPAPIMSRRPVPLRDHRAGRLRLHGARLAPGAEEDPGAVGRPGPRRAPSYDGAVAARHHLPRHQRHDGAPRQPDRADRAVDRTCTAPTRPPTGRRSIGAHTLDAYQVGAAIVVESCQGRRAWATRWRWATTRSMPCAPMGASYIEDRDLCAAARAVDFFGIADLGGPDDPPPPPPPPPAATRRSRSPAVRRRRGRRRDADRRRRLGARRPRARRVRDRRRDQGLRRERPYTYRWQTASFDPGDHTIDATAVDIYGRTATASITVTVNPDVPGSGADSVDPIPCGCRTDGGTSAGSLHPGPRGAVHHRATTATPFAVGGR